MATTKATLLGHRSATSFSDLTLSGDLTVNGTTTTLDTAVQNVDKLEIGASSTDYGAKINQASTGNILQLQDGSTDVMVVADGGNVGIGVSDPNVELEIKKSSANATLAINAGSANDAQLQFRTGDANDFAIYVDGSETNDPLQFYDYASASNMMTLVNGKVGIGTTSPSSLCTIKRATSGIVTVLQLQNTNTQQDDGAKILFTAGESTDGAGIGSGGQALHSADLRFYTGGSSSSHVRMQIDTVGKVAINCTPSASNQGRLEILEGTEGKPGIRINKSTSTNTSDQVFLEFVVAGHNQTANGRIVGNGASAATFSSWSDERLKENITPLTSQLNVINSLKPVKFNWKSNGEHGVGFIAQEFQNVFPKQVSTDPPTEEQIDNEETGTMSIAGWSSTEAILVSAIQELSAKVTALENA